MTTRREFLSASAAALGCCTLPAVELSACGCDCRDKPDDFSDCPEAWAVVVGPWNCDAECVADAVTFLRELSP